jgi:hypothetical protein
MTYSESVTAKKGDTILKVFKSGTVWEIVVVSWGKKRATLVRKELVGQPAEEWSKYHLMLENGKIASWSIERNEYYYKNI